VLTSSSFTLAQAIKSLFKIELSKQLQIKTLVHSLQKSNVIKSTKVQPTGGFGSRGKIYIQRDQFDLIYNAVILQGLFSETKKITKILNDSKECLFRQQMADFASVILVERQSIVGITLLPPEVDQFLKILGSDVDLSCNRLPNPFKILPQLILNESTNTIQAFIAQNTVLSDGDSMMLYYLDGDLEMAWKAAQQLETNDLRLNQYKSLIVKEYSEAQEFEELLDLIK